MADTLKTLIKVTKSELDRMRQELARMRLAVEQLAEAIVGLDKDIENEQAFLKEVPEMKITFLQFVQKTRQRQAELRQVQARMERDILVMDSRILDKFSELKRYETIQQNNKIRAQKAALHKETLMLDELATGQHVRKSQLAQEADSMNGGGQA